MNINSNRSAARSACASTITEVVVAILVLAVGSAGLMSCLGYGFKTIQHVRENQRATQILLEKLETIRLYSWDQVNSNGFIPSTFTATYDGNEIPTDYEGTIYTGKVSIASFPWWDSNYRDRMRVVRLTLQWRTQNILRTRGLATYIAKDGIQNYVY